MEIEEKKRLKGIAQDPPSAMLDAKGNLLTSSKALEKLSLDMFTERLKSHKMKDELKLHEMQREQMFEKQMKEAQENTTSDWRLDDVNIVLKQLKIINQGTP